MRRWGVAYLGRSTFPKDVSEFELQRAFTFTHRERRDIRKAFRIKYRLAAALQLGFLRLTGNALASVAYVPTVVLHHLGRQFRGRFPISRRSGRSTAVSRRGSSTIVGRSSTPAS